MLRQQMEWRLDKVSNNLKLVTMSELLASHSNARSEEWNAVLDPRERAKAVDAVREVQRMSIYGYGNAEMDEEGDPIMVEKTRARKVDVHPPGKSSHSTLLYYSQKTNNGD